VLQGPDPIRVSPEAIVPYPQAEVIYKPGFDFFRYADRLEMIPLVDSSSDSEMTSLCISGSSLARLIGDGLAQQLITRLGLDAPPVVKVMAMPLAISAALRASVSTTLRGPLKLLFAQSKALEYLCGLATHLGVTESDELHANETPEKIRDLHANLMKLQGRLPTLNELAADFGVSGNWLNREFSREYGQSIYSFVTHHRLTEAHVALVDGDLPIRRCPSDWATLTSITSPSRSRTSSAIRRAACDARGCRRRLHP
jgi:AraC-like DNA-binding protein